MWFEWDRVKEAANRQKHGFDFSFAARVFDDRRHVIAFDRVVNGEDRWHALGLVNGVTLLLVVHAYPDATDQDYVRVISLRRATPHERRRYEEG